MKVRIAANLCKNRMGLFYVFIFTAILSVNFLFSTPTFAQGGGDKYIQDALKTLLALRTLECDIRIETYVDGKEYTARGRYEEQTLPKITPNMFLRSMYRLEIYFSMNSSQGKDAEPNRMTLVCHPSDDRVWNQIERYTCVEGVKNFTTIDLTRLEERLKAASKESVFAQISEVRNLGGIAGAMRQIQRFYTFAAPVQETLQEDETIAAWKLTGTLQTIYQKELLSLFGESDKKGHYPPDFPSDVEVWLGLHNNFPYKVRYLRRQSEQSSQREPILQESFYRVILNGTPIPVSKFTPLTPPDNVFPQDETDNVIKMLGL